MYQLLCLANGMIMAVMISVNGSLSQRYSSFTAAAVIHAVGSAFALVLCALQKNKKPLWEHRPIWIYLGGAIGVITTVSQNLALGTISIISVIALGLLGQTVTSLAIDGFGLFGMEKRPLPGYAVIGLGIAVFGISVMLDATVTGAAAAVGLSFLSGITLVLSRTVNARLAEKTGALRGSLVNHLMGLPITVLIALWFSGGTAYTLSLSEPVKPWIYMGGILGVAVVMLLNVSVPKVPAFILTLLVFVGQVFAGIVLDIMAKNSYSDASFWGGIIIAAGMGVNMVMERVSRRRNFHK